MENGAENSIPGRVPGIVSCSRLTAFSEFWYSEIAAQPSLGVEYVHQIKSDYPVQISRTHSKPHDCRSVFVLSNSPSANGEEREVGSDYWLNQPQAVGSPVLRGIHHHHTLHPPLSAGRPPSHVPPQVARSPSVWRQMVTPGRVLQMGLFG